MAPNMGPSYVNNLIVFAIEMFPSNYDIINFVLDTLINVHSDTSLCRSDL